MLDYERQATQKGYRFIAGVDEAGRGPLAGPVVAAAVILPADMDFEGLDDSKKLSPAARDQWFDIIQNACTGFGIGVADHETIDAINILQATRVAMKRAVENLTHQTDYLLIDGNQPIDHPLKQQTLVGGDGLSYSIAAASVLAKVTRDRLMEEYHRLYPEYDFQKHKGYGTRLHRQRIQEFGPCSIHRKTFKGVREHLTVSAPISRGINTGH